MATKLFKGRNNGNVFDKVADEVGEEEAASAEEAVEPGESLEAEAEAGPEADADVDASSDVNVEASSETAAAGPPARGVWRGRIVAGAVGAVIVAVLATSGWLAWEYKQQRDIDSAGRGALAAAQSYGVLLTSIDTNHIDENFTKVLDGATGEFKDMYSQSANQLRQVLIDNKAMSKGTVIDSAVKSASKDKVEVLLFIDQSISNKINPEARIDRNRVAMTMQLVDNRWLASQVDIM